KALYKFFLSQSACLPKFLLWCQGTHSETQTIQQAVQVRDTPGGPLNPHEFDGYHTEYVAVKTTVTVVDFDFYIDVALYQPTSRVYSRKDSDPVYRGGGIREVDLPDGKMRARADGVGAFKARPSSPGSLQLGSSQTIRQWADEYWYVIAKYVTIRCSLPECESEHSEAVQLR
ncbi:hypothetical protein B0H13DRAFT_1616241, partial [Mycena leptocephala]